MVRNFCILVIGEHDTLTVRTMTKTKARQLIREALRRANYGNRFTKEVRIYETDSDPAVMDRRLGNYEDTLNGDFQPLTEALREGDYLDAGYCWDIFVYHRTAPGSPYPMGDLEDTITVYLDEKPYVTIPLRGDVQLDGVERKAVWTSGGWVYR